MANIETGATKAPISRACAEKWLQGGTTIFGKELARIAAAHRELVVAVDTAVRPPRVSLYYQTKSGVRFVCSLLTTGLAQLEEALQLGREALERAEAEEDALPTHGKDHSRRPGDPPAGFRNGPR